MINCTFEMRVWPLGDDDWTDWLPVAQLNFDKDGNVGRVISQSEDGRDFGPFWNIESKEFVVDGKQRVEIRQVLKDGPEKT